MFDADAPTTSFSTLDATLTPELWEFILDQTHGTKSTKDSNIHISGHKDSKVNGTTGAFFFMSMIIIVLATIYLFWRVYIKNKLLSAALIKQYGYNVA